MERVFVIKFLQNLKSLWNKGGDGVGCKCRFILPPVIPSYVVPNSSFKLNILDKLIISD